MRSLRRNLNSRHFKNWQGDSQYTAYNSVPGCKLPRCYHSSAYLPDHVFSLNSPHFGKFHRYHTLYTTDPQTNFINKGIRSFAFKVLHAPFNCFLPFQPSFFFLKRKIIFIKEKWLRHRMCMVQFSKNTNHNERKWQIKKRHWRNAALGPHPIVGGLQNMLFSYKGRMFDSIKDPLVSVIPQILLFYMTITILWWWKCPWSQIWVSPRPSQTMQR